MYREIIAIVDATRARLFTFEHAVDGGGVQDVLDETSDLVNPARRRRPSELFSDTRPGASRAGGVQFAFDDHREDHVQTMDAEFARAVTSEIERLLEASGARRLIVCASPNMLGELRAARRRTSVEIEELSRDLVKLTVPELRDRLASYGLLPPRPPRPGLARQV